MKNLPEWLEQIEKYHPQEIELGLERIERVANRMGILQSSANIIVVGGTNGKGSCVAALESLALSSELSVGCYTSPHLLKFNERIRINGQDIDDQSLVEAFECIEKHREDVALTFFEFTTLAALYNFAKISLDLLVLEIGLGGRLDAVNIVDPSVSIITTIDKDHEAWLGSNLQGIAKEKAGIYRNSSYNLIGDKKSQELVQQVVTSQKLSPHLAAQQISEHQAECRLPGFDLRDSLDNPRINPYRLLKQNIECAVAAFAFLYPERSSQLDLARFLRSIQIKGRWQKLTESPLTILDVGHNRQAALNLAQQIETLVKPAYRIAICGLMADKAIKDFLSPLAAHIDHWIFVDLPIQRAAKAADLMALYRSMKIAETGKPLATCEIAESVLHGFDKARQMKAKQKQVFVLGSFITVAEMLQNFQET